jgi:hypothetical protein
MMERRGIHARLVSVAGANPVVFGEIHTQECEMHGQSELWPLRSHTVLTDAGARVKIARTQKGAPTVLRDTSCALLRMIIFQKNTLTRYGTGVGRSRRTICEPI